MLPTHQLELLYAGLGAGEIRQRSEQGIESQPPGHWSGERGKILDPEVFVRLLSSPHDFQEASGRLGGGPVHPPAPLGGARGLQDTP